jgi:hypothetical protein
VHGVKRAIKEAGEGGGAAAPARRARGGVAAPARGGEAAEPPRRKVPPPLRAPKVNFEDACFSVKMLYQAWQSLGKVAIHLGVQ